MRTAAHAFAWEFFHRRRWGFSAVAGYLLILIVYNIFHTGPASSERFAFTVIVPSTFCFLYFVAVFSFGFAGDISARASLYPARFFTLPLTTNSLVLAPMLFGMAATGTLAIATSRLGFAPAGINLPLIWPPLFATVFIGWAQALMWLPYGLRNLRVILAAGWLIMVDTIVISAMIWKASQPTMLVILAPQLPVVYLTARYAVAAARRGHVPDWQFGLTLSRSAAASSLTPFTSAQRAQLWLEWRENGRSLLVLTGMLVPFELALLFIGGNTHTFVYVMLATVALTPPFMAACTAATMRAPTTFGATRPLASSNLVAAKLQVAALSTALTWLIVLVATTLALSFSGSWPAVTSAAHYFAKYMGAPRAIVLALLVLLWLVVSTWRQLVQSLYVSLTGRAWLMKGVVFATLVLMVALVPIGDWVLGSSPIEAALWHSLRWILASLVLVKMSAAAWTATRLYSTRLVTDRTLVVGAAAWSVGVLLLHGLLLWLLRAPQVPAYYTLLLAILAVPLARVSAAPLALAWSRHR